MLTRSQLKSIYEKALSDDNHYASDDIQTADDNFEDALMAYITAIQEDTFYWAYELGFKAGQGAAMAEDVQEEREEEGWI